MEMRGIGHVQAGRTAAVTTRLRHDRHRHDRHRLDPPSSLTVPEPHAIRSVSVIGAGLMGRAIAAASASQNIPVTITDTSPETLANGVAEILRELALHNGNDPRAAGAEHRPALVRASTSDAELAQSDLIIEAVAEKLNVKKRLFARLERLLNGDTILASNTSAIPISRIAAGLTRPERLCGMHFCHPVKHRRLVEVIRGEKTSDQTLATALRYAESIGKLPIIVQDSPGFLINRLLLSYISEALELVLEGAGIESIEAAAQAFGMPAGPLEQLDAIGIDVAVRAGSVLHSAFPDRVVASEFLIALYKAGRLGQKSGAGFFCYERAIGTRKRDPQVDALIRERLRSRKQFTSEELTMRLFLPMLVEATRVLEEKLVRDVCEVDRGLAHGIGLRTSHGGLLRWADALGAQRVVELLKPFEQLGTRYQPTEMLLEMAGNARRFYE